MTTATNLTERAMLVDLTVRRWGGYKSDKVVNQEVADNHNSDITMGNYAKRLIDRKVAFKRINEIHTQASTIHFTYTLPWLDTGQRILSSAAYFIYTEKMRAVKADWEDAVQEFCTEFPAYVEEARQRLNGLFRESEYPSVGQVRSKFSLGYHFTPMPAAQDFRVDLNDEEQAAVKADIEANVQEGLKDALRDIAGRIEQRVGHMAERLRAYSVTEEGKKGIFRDSMLENVKSLVELIPVLNITDDPTLTALAVRMGDELLEHAVDTLRFDPIIRERVATAAEDILAKVKEFAL